MALQHLRSSTANKRPTPAAMADGQIAINTEATSPGLFFKNASGSLVKVGPVHVGTTAPNASPASGGETGNTLGEQWLDTTGGTYVFKVWDGSAWRSETGTFVDVNGDTMTGALGIIAGSAASPGLFVSGDTNTGIYSPGADQLAISTNGTGRLFVDASGRLSLGTATATAQLFLEHPTVSDFRQSVNTVLQTNIYASSSDVNIFSVQANPLRFGTNNTERLRITSAGLVGIGTSTPTAGLTVGLGNNSIPAPGATGAAALFGNSVSAHTYGLILGAATTGAGYIQAQRADGTATTYDLHLQPNGGRVGIGTTVPGELLTVNGANQSLLVRTSDLNGSARIKFNADDSNYAGIGLESSALVMRCSNSSTPTERARIDSSGRLLVGTSSARATYFGAGVSAGINVENAGNLSSPNRAISVVNGYSGSADGDAIVYIGRTRSDSLGGTTIVQSQDYLGRVAFVGSDGTNMLAAAQIRAEVDGTPGTNDMPGRLVFSTTADGASSPTERFRIRANGLSSFFNTGFVIPETDNATALGGGTNRWSAVFAVNGTIQTSDARAKTAIADSSLGSDFVKALRPVSYKWIEGGQRHTGEYDDEGNFVYETTPGARTHWGFIAQEVKEAVDAAGVDFGGWVLTDKDDPDSQQALRYDQFIAPLTKALQEALAKIEQLEQRLADAGI